MTLLVGNLFIKWPVGLALNCHRHNSYNAQNRRYRTYPPVEGFRKHQTKSVGTLEYPSLKMRCQTYLGTVADQFKFKFAQPR